MHALINVIPSGNDLPPCTAVDLGLVIGLSVGGSFVLISLPFIVFVVIFICRVRYVRAREAANRYSGHGGRTRIVAYTAMVVTGDLVEVCDYDRMESCFSVVELFLPVVDDLCSVDKRDTVHLS